MRINGFNGGNLCHPSLGRSAKADSLATLIPRPARLPPIAAAHTYCLAVPTLRRRCGDEDRLNLPNQSSNLRIHS